MNYNRAIPTKKKEVKTEPMVKPSTIKKVGNWLKTAKNDKGTRKFDPAYHLIYLISVSTGARISDVCKMHIDNFDLDNAKVTFYENKGSKANMARAKHAVLVKMHKVLLQHYSGDKENSFEVGVMRPREVYGKQLCKKTGKPVGKVVFHPLVPEFMQPRILKEVEIAVHGAEFKEKTARITPQIIQLIKERQAKYGAINDGFLFSKLSLKSNRARGNGEGVITRQSCWKVFSQISEFVTSLGEKLKVSCHGLRKTYCRQMYINSGNDIAKVMKFIGHADVGQTLTYLGIKQDDDRHIHHDFAKQCGL